MNYTIISTTGWKAGAQSQDEAIDKGLRHAQEWREVGKEIQFHIYYRDGSEIFYTATPVPCDDEGTASIF